MKVGRIMDSERERGLEVSMRKVRSKEVRRGRLRSWRTRSR